MQILIKLFSKLIYLINHKFIKALSNPKFAQQKVKQDIVKNLIKSEYGKSLNINSIDDWERIPIVEYDDIKEWIIKQQQTQKSLLTNEPIIFYEKTSGSRGAAKFIPYTKSLRHSFNQMFCIWAYDLITNGPQFSTGKIYFCISPNLTTKTHSNKTNSSGENGAKIGLEDDSEYLDNWLRWLLSPFLVSVPGIKSIQNAEEFKHKLALALLAAENLEIISVWSPTFLKVILDYIRTHRHQLCADLKNKISPQRHSILLSQKTDNKPEQIPWNLLWKQLKLISCWDSVNAADGAEFLRSLFPGVLVQGKGLLATEAPMTIPLISARGYVPVLNEVFFEFEDENSNIFQLHQLKQGNTYEIIISQKGGLYRYRIGDRVRITHFYQSTPCLEFLGRTQEISDLVGEKLNSQFVREVLESLPLESASFKSLVPVKEPQEHYILLLDKLQIDANIIDSNTITTSSASEIAQKLDTALQKSPQYRHARLLGQLQPVRLIISSQIPEIIAQFKTQSGTKWGDLKHEILVTTPIASKLLKDLIDFHG
ncbi:MAG: GH3 auxin-responsive promoter family protein [Cyanobacteria bacterium J06639_18]